MLKWQKRRRWGKRGAASRAAAGHPPHLPACDVGGGPGQLPRQQLPHDLRYGVVHQGHITRQQRFGRCTHQPSARPAHLRTGRAATMHSHLRLASWPQLPPCGAVRTLRQHPPGPTHHCKGEDVAALGGAPAPQHLGRKPALQGLRGGCVGGGARGEFGGEITVWTGLQSSMQTTLAGPILQPRGSPRPSSGANSRRLAGRHGRSHCRPMYRACRIRTPTPPYTHPHPRASSPGS